MFQPIVKMAEMPALNLENEPVTPQLSVGDLLYMECKGVERDGECKFMIKRHPTPINVTESMDFKKTLNGRPTKRVLVICYKQSLYIMVYKNKDLSL